MNDLIEELTIYAAQCLACGQITTFEKLNKAIDRIRELENETRRSN